MKRKTTGFTLIELLVTIVVAAILLSIGVPGFQAMLATNRMATTTNEFATSMSIARSEAIKRRTNVSVTATDGTDAGNEWGKGGWSVTVTGGGPTIKVVDPILDSSTTLDSTGNRTSYTYESSGIVSTGNADTLNLCPGPGERGRQITILATGRVAIDTGFTCPL